jgi:predicted DNA-binding transcriptional regulator
MTDDRPTQPASERPTLAGSTSVREELRQFGFSDAEVETYLGVLSRGEATARTVASETSVSQRAVYDIVERLERRGLVRVKDHASPTTVRAVPPDEAIGALTTRLESITPALEEQFSDSRPKAPEMRMVKSRETAVGRLRRAVREAAREVLLALPGDLLPEVRDDLRDAVDRGALVFLLLGDAEGPGRVRPEEYVDLASAVRCWKADLPYLFAVDQERAMIGGSDLVASTPTHEPGVAVSQEHLTGSVLGLFLSAYWPASTEVHVADPLPLPREFDWFRRCVFCAAQHRRHGRSLHATVETVSGTSVTGPVVEVRHAFLEPPTNEFPLETSLVVSTDEGRVSVGGIGSFIEDYEAASVTLRALGEE